MMLAMLCLPMAMMAQNRGGATPPSKDGQRGAAVESSLTCEVIVQQRGSVTAVTIDLGSAPEITFANDKHVMSASKSLTSSRFTNVVDALNMLTQLGFEVEGSYVVGEGAGSATHIILCKEGRAGSAKTSQGSTGTAPAKEESTPDKGSSRKRK